METIISPDQLISRFVKVVTTMIFLGFACTSSATIIYEETSPAPSTNDIDNTPQTFNLIAGLSEVIGNYGVNGPTLPNGNKDDSDNFTIIVPANHTVQVSAFRDWQLTGVTAGDPAQLQILDSAFNTLSTFTTLTGSIVTPFTAGQIFAASLAGGTSYSFILDHADPGTVDEWSLQFNVQPSAVPVPAAIWLMGSGMMALLGMSHRRKTTA